MTLTHWCRVTHICASKLSIIGLNSGWSPGRYQAIIWANDAIWLIRKLGTNISEILIEIQLFSFKKMHLKMSLNWLPFCFGRNMLTFIMLILQGRVQWKMDVVEKQPKFLCSKNPQSRFDMTNKLWIHAKFSTTGATNRHINYPAILTINERVLVYNFGIKYRKGHHLCQRHRTLYLRRLCECINSIPRVMCVSIRWRYNQPAGSVRR